MSVRPDLAGINFRSGLRKVEEETVSPRPCADRGQLPVGARQFRCGVEQTEDAGPASVRIVPEEAVARSGQKRDSRVEQHRNLPAVRLLARFEFGGIGRKIGLLRRGGVAHEVQADHRGNARPGPVREIPQHIDRMFSASVLKMNGDFPSAAASAEYILLPAFEFEADPFRPGRDLPEQMGFQQMENFHSPAAGPVRGAAAPLQRGGKTGDGTGTFRSQIHDGMSFPNTVSERRGFSSSFQKGSIAFQESSA